MSLANYTLVEQERHSCLVEGVVGRNLAEDVGRIPAGVVDHIPAAIAGRNPVDDSAHNPAEVVDHTAAGRIPDWVHHEVADHIQ